MQKKSALNPTVIKLGLVSFFADVSSEMLYPITPIFLTTVLGASMASVGLIEGSAEAIASLLKTFSGYWSDRWRARTPFITAGYFLAAVAKPLIGSAASWPEVLLARGLDRTGKGIRSAPRDALLSNAVSPELRGAAFGWHRAMDTLGATLGPLLALAFLSAGQERLRSLYYWALIPGLLALLLTLSLRESKTEVAARPQRMEIGKAKFNRAFYTFLFSWTIFSLANSSDVFLLMKAKQEGLGLPSVILLYCFYNLAYALLSPYLGILSDRIERKWVLIGGLVLFAFVYAGFGLANAHWQLWVLFGAYGIYMAATDGVGKALAVDLIPPKFKATGLGLLGTATGLSALIASTVAGMLWERLGSGAPFYYGALGALLAAALLVGVNSVRDFART